MIETKRCSKCGETKPLSEFPLSSRAKNDGTRSRRAECKSCYSVRSGRWSRENKEKANASALAWKRRNRERHNENARRWTRRNRFKVAITNSRQCAKRNGHTPCTATAEEVESAFDGSCNICGVKEDGSRHRLHMDHDHETGEFRGWLCGNCNKGLGHFMDSHELLNSASSYLRRPQK